MGQREDVAAMLQAVQSLDGLQVAIIRESMVTTGVNALVGETIQSIDDGSGVVVDARSRDFIICKDDYRLGGVVAIPAADDCILDTSSGEPRYYQVLPFFGQEQKRWHDPFGSAWRIHTKLGALVVPTDIVTFDSTLVTFDSIEYTMDMA